MAQTQIKYLDLGESLGDSGLGTSISETYDRSSVESDSLCEPGSCRGDDEAAPPTSVARWFTPDEDGDTYLHRYICQRKEKEAAALIHLVQDARLLDIQNKYQQAAIHLAAVLDMYHILLMLINKGARIDLTDCQGNNIFHIIADLNNVKALEAAVTLPLFPTKLYILCARSALDAQNYNGLSPFFIATQRKHLKMCQYLAHVGADVNIPDQKNGNNAIHEAVRMNEPQLVDTLIRHCRVDLNHTNFVGSTPLHCATGLGYDDIVAILMMNGADIDVADDEGRSSFDYSANESVSKLFRQLIT